MIFASTPFAIMHRGQIPAIREIRERDRAFYERLAASGFRLDFADEVPGLMMKAFRSGSGYYIDVGASELIASGEDRGSQRRRNPPPQRQIGRALGRDRAARRSHRLRDRLSVDEQERREKSSLRTWRRQGRQMLGTRIRNAGRSRGLGRVSRATCGSRRSRKGSGSTAAICTCRVLFALPRSATESAHGGARHAGLRPPGGPPHALDSRCSGQARRDEFV